MSAFNILGLKVKMYLLSSLVWNLQGITCPLLSVHAQSRLFSEVKWVLRKVGLRDSNIYVHFFFKFETKLLHLYFFSSKCNDIVDINAFKQCTLFSREIIQGLI